MSRAFGMTTAALAVVLALPAFAQASQAAVGPLIGLIVLLAVVRLVWPVSRRRRW